MLKVVLIMLVAGLILSTGGPIIRQIDDATGFQIVFWRSVSQSVLVFLFLFFRDYRRVFNTFVGIGVPGVGASICLGLAFFGFVFSITERPGGAVRFRSLRAPTSAELTHLAHVIAQQFGRFL